ncbi:MAG TPA: hypothetical protein VJ123_04750 [Anaerolineales bacterium]|nr:hypothetical protein [Anaerolineales bacterium]
MSEHRKAAEKIPDPVLGDGDIFFSGSKRAWACFRKEFAPTKSRILVVASVVGGSVPQHQRELYREIESRYPEGAQGVHDAIRREVESDEGLRKWLPPRHILDTRQLEALRNWMPPDQISTRLQLLRIDLRHPFPLPAKWILTYQFGPNKPVWYARIGEDFHVEWCGLGD